MWILGGHWESRMSAYRVQWRQVYSILMEFEIILRKFLYEFGDSSTSIANNPLPQCTHQSKRTFENTLLCLCAVMSFPLWLYSVALLESSIPQTLFITLLVSMMFWLICRYPRFVSATIDEQHLYRPNAVSDILQPNAGDNNLVRVRCKANNHQISLPWTMYLLSFFLS